MTTPLAETVDRIAAKQDAYQKSVREEYDRMLSELQRAATVLGRNLNQRPYNYGDWTLRATPQGCYFIPWIPTESLIPRKVSKWFWGHSVVSLVTLIAVVVIPQAPVSLIPLVVVQWAVHFVRASIPPRKNKFPCEQWQHCHSHFDEALAAVRKGYNDIKQQVEEEAAAIESAV